MGGGHFSLLVPLCLNEIEYFRAPMSLQIEGSRKIFGTMEHRVSYRKSECSNCHCAKYWEMCLQREFCAAEALFKGEMYGAKLGLC